MNNEKRNYSPRENVRKFVDWEIADFNANWPIARLMDALEKNPLLVRGGYLNDVLPSPDCAGVVRTMGWEFDFRPYLSCFVAKVRSYDRDGERVSTNIREYVGVSEEYVRKWIEEAGRDGDSAWNEILWLIPEPGDMA